MRGASLTYLLVFSSLLFRAEASLTVLARPLAAADFGGTGTDGYPYAILVQIQGWSAAANSQAYLKVYSGSSNEFMWSALGTWSNDIAFSNANQPVVSIDGSGNWVGWIYAKHNHSIIQTVSVRGAKVGSTGTQQTSPSFSLSILSMTTTGDGGWVVRQSSPAENKGIVAYAGTEIVGTYRTEDNGIVEGYSYGPGGFRIAVPAGIIDSLVSLNDDGSRDQVFVGPWVVSAGHETDVSAGGGGVGHGVAGAFPSVVQGGVPAMPAFSLRGESPYVITNAVFVVPPSWSWSHQTADLTVTGGGSPSVAITGDSIVLSSMSLTPTDTVGVAIANVILPDTTAVYAIAVLSGTAPDSVYPVGATPSIFSFSTPLAIADAKQNDANGVPLRNNTLITIRGIVTVANEFGGPSYLQDNSGGMAIFGSSFSTAVQPGDEVLVSGLVQPFSGLSEIVNPVLHAVLSAGNVVDPVIATAQQIAGDGAGGVEVYEGRLVRMNGVTVGGSGTWAANTNYALSDGTGSTEIRIDNSTNLPGTPIPAGSFDLIGVVGQFISNPPYIGGYQVMPRSVADLLTTGPIIASAPIESSIASDALTISWQTIHPGSSALRYGLTPAFELGLVGSPDATTDHTVALTSLSPATVYYIKPFSVAAAETSFASTLVSSSASAPPTTGAINVYFNKSVNTGLAWYQPALGNQNLTARIIGRIDNAHRTIDAALYSLSGAPGNAIATALINARNRGVGVRVIHEYDNGGTQALSMLIGAGIPVINDRFDVVNFGAGLHHNKFFVIDGRGGAPESVWVWTGSWNPTDPGTNDDYQNAIEFQDQALANAYTLEFNEMWGSNTLTPVQANSRFGARKTDNTPHRFVIGGRDVECYFSPSDGVTAHLVAEVSAAQHSVAFALLTFTRSDIATAVIGRHNAGKDVRGVMDNSSDQGSQYTNLTGAGVDVRLKTGGGLFHHKYAIMDAEDPSWHPVLVTGSHNWSSSAENSNNENTVIVRDANIANQYLQEFAARYYQFGGVDTILVGVTPEGTPSSFALWQNFPNPFNPVTHIRFSLPVASDVRLTVFDLLGREVTHLVDGQRAAGLHDVAWDASGVASGVYFYRLSTPAGTLQHSMILIR